MYENKIELINSLAKNILYYFKTENNITFNNLKKYLMSNNEINIDIEDLITILESNGIIYFYNNHYNLYDKYNSVDKINEKLNEIEEIKLADLICNFNMTIKTEKITNEELNKYISNYLEFNKLIKDLYNSEIIIEKNNNIFITIDKDKEKAKLLEEKKKIESELARANKMLSNEAFVAKAPQKLIDGEKDKVVKYTELLEKVKESLAKFN